MSIELKSNTPQNIVNLIFKIIKHMTQMYIQVHTHYLVNRTGY